MGTKGCYGFYKNKEDKLTYNHLYSYPSGLGADIVKFIKETSVEEMNEIFDKIVVVKKDEKPSKKEIDECVKFYSKSLNNKYLDTWYHLLRFTQGDLHVYKNGLKYMIDYKNFMKNSLMCEWAYIINLDDNIFEIYKGLQKYDAEEIYNRYKIKESFVPCYECNDSYYNVGLIKEYSLNNIPENWPKEIHELITSTKNSTKIYR